MTLAEFEIWERIRRQDDTLYELIDGVPVAMAEADRPHGELVARAAVALGSRLRPPCRLYTAAKVRLPHRERQAYRPDLAVVCSPRNATREKGSIADPVLIVEVLSPSTADFDRGTKLDDYQEIPTLNAIVFVYTDRRRVRLVERETDGWRLRDHIGQAAVPLRALGIDLPLDDLYDGIALNEPGPDQS